MLILSKSRVLVLLISWFRFQWAQRAHFCSEMCPVCATAGRWPVPGSLVLRGPEPGVRPAAAAEHLIRVTRVLLADGAVGSSYTLAGFLPAGPASLRWGAEVSTCAGGPVPSRF